MLRGCDCPPEGQQEHTGSSAPHCQNLVLGQLEDSLGKKTHCSPQCGGQGWKGHWGSPGRVELAGSIPEHFSPTCPYSLTSLPTAASLLCPSEPSPIGHSYTVSSQIAIHLPEQSICDPFPHPTGQCSSTLPGGGRGRRYLGDPGWGCQKILCYLLLGLADLWGGGGKGGNR